MPRHLEPSSTWIAPPALPRQCWQVPEFEVLEWLDRQGSMCVIIPVVNEGPRIARVLHRIRELGLDRCVDVIIVDGGSRDGSLELPLLRATGVRGLLRKLGPGRLSAQLRAGYAFALDHGYEGIITIDGNGKDDPEAIPEFVAALSAGFDFVQASRYLPGGIAQNTPLLRDLAIRYLHAPLLSLRSGFRWTDTTQGFRGYSRRMLLDPRIAVFRDIFAGYELLAYLSAIAPRLGYRCVELPTARRYPKHGPAPTKINGARANLGLLRVLIYACLGGYDPPEAAFRR